MFGSDRLKNRSPRQDRKNASLWYDLEATVDIQINAFENKKSSY